MATGGGGGGGGGGLGGLEGDESGDEGVVRGEVEGGEHHGGVQLAVPRVVAQYP